LKHEAHEVHETDGGKTRVKGSCQRVLSEGSSSYFFVNFVGFVFQGFWYRLLRLPVQRDDGGRPENARFSAVSGAGDLFREIPPWLYLPGRVRDTVTAPTGVAPALGRFFGWPMLCINAFRGELCDHLTIDPA
jgi:hypothetical protein